MTTFTRTTDLDFVRTVFTHPDVYPWIVDDYSVPVEEFVPVDHPSIWYIVAEDAEGTLGIFMLVPHNSICWELHTCLLPCGRGNRAAHAGTELFKWLWENTSCQRIVTSVPAYNRRASRMAGMCGMQRYGINKQSFLKDGQLHDQYLYGISPTEVQ